MNATDAGPSDAGQPADGGGPPGTYPDLATPRMEVPLLDGNEVFVGATAIDVTPGGAPVLLGRRGAADDDIAIAVRVGPVWHVEQLGTDIDWPIVRVGPRGYPHLLFIRQADGALQYARFRLGMTDKRIIDRRVARSEAPFFDLAIAANGQAHVAWFDTEDDDLKYAVFNGASFQVEVVDTHGDVGRYVSLALSADGTPHLSYSDEDTDTLEYATKVGGVWRTESIMRPQSLVEPVNDIAVDAAGRPVIAYGLSPADGMVQGGLWSARFDGAVWRHEHVQAGLIRRVDLSIDGLGGLHFGVQCERCGPFMPGGDPPMRLLYIRPAVGGFETTLVAEQVSFTHMVVDRDLVPHFVFGSDAQLFGGDLAYASYDIPRSQPGLTQAMISAAAGGTVMSADGRVRLAIPAGALSADTLITMTPADAPSGAAPVGPVYDFGPEGLTFATPASLQVDLAWEDTFALFNDGGLTWPGVRQQSQDGLQQSALPASSARYDAKDATGTVTASISHFTVNHVTDPRLDNLLRSAPEWATSHAAAGFVELTRQARQFFDVFNPNDAEDCAYVGSGGTLLAAATLKIGMLPETLPVRFVARGPIAVGTANTTLVVRPGEYSAVETTWRCTSVGFASVTGYIEVVAPALGVYEFIVEVDIECKPRPGCSADDVLSPAEALGLSLGAGNAACDDLRTTPSGQETKNTFDPGTRTPPPDPGQGDETQIAAFGAYSLTLNAADVLRLFNMSDYPCGAGANGYTLCPSADPVPAGDYVVVTNVLHTPIPISQPKLHYQYGFVFDADGDAMTGYTPPRSAPNDFFSNGDLWFEALYDPAMGWSMQARRVTTGAPMSVPSNARLIIRDNVITAVIPASEIATPEPSYRVTAFRHTGRSGTRPPYDWAGDIEPPLTEPMAPFSR